MIIVEGCFKEENSAVVERLMHDFPYMELAPEPPAKGSREATLAYISLIASRCARHTGYLLLNGFPFFYELVLDSVKGGDPSLPLHQAEIIADRLAAHNPLVLYCWREPTAAEERAQPLIRSLLRQYDTVLECFKIGRLERIPLSDPSLNSRIYEIVQDYLWPAW